MGTASQHRLTESSDAVIVPILQMGKPRPFWKCIQAMQVAGELLGFVAKFLWLQGLFWKPLWLLRPVCSRSPTEHTHMSPGHVSIAMKDSPRWCLKKGALSPFQGPMGAAASAALSHKGQNHTSAGWAPWRGSRGDPPPCSFWMSAELSPLKDRPLPLLCPLGATRLPEASPPHLMAASLCLQGPGLGAPPAFSWLPVSLSCLLCPGVLEPWAALPASGPVPQPAALMGLGTCLPAPCSSRLSVKTGNPLGRR